MGSRSRASGVYTGVSGGDSATFAPQEMLWVHFVEEEPSRDIQSLLRSVTTACQTPRGPKNARHKPLALNHAVLATRGSKK